MSTTPNLPPTGSEVIAAIGLRGQWSESAEGFRAPRRATAEQTAVLCARVRELAASRAPLTR